MKKILWLFVLLLAIGAGAAAFWWMKTGSLPFSSPRALTPEERAASDREAQLEKGLRDMNEAQRLGQPALLPGQTVPGRNPTADIQRTLRTLDEINRINRMNQELRQQNPPSPPPQKQ